MPTEQILIAVAVGLLVVWVAYRTFRRPAEERARVPQISLPGGVPVALPPSVARGNWLVGVGGDVEGKTFHVGARTVTIGRGVSNYIQTTDADASRVHCRLTPVPAGLEVTDLGSKNGVLINGTAAKSGVLRDGDELQIGRARFQYSPAGSFRYDDALGGKIVGHEASRATVGLNVAQLARKALDDAGGDVQEAARRMGVTPEVLLRLLE